MKDNECIDEMEEDTVCDADLCIVNEVEDATEFTWIGCDCERWFHLYCVGLATAEDSFVCSFCCNPRDD